MKFMGKTSTDTSSYNDPDVIFDRKLVAHYKLLPCPFCGSTNTQIRGTYMAYGICLNCESSTGLHHGREAAEEAWNRRTNNANST